MEGPPRALLSSSPLPVSQGGFHVSDDPKCMILLGADGDSSVDRVPTFGPLPVQAPALPVVSKAGRLVQPPTRLGDYILE